MKILIGRTDIADFPDLKIYKVPVKIDTGAYTSAIHASDIEEIQMDGGPYVQFKILDETHPEFHGKLFRYRNYSRRTIKNSFGQSEDRFVIKTNIELFGMAYSIALSLSERTDLKYPVLLGRKFLNSQFIIDPSLKNLSFKSKK